MERTTDSDSGVRSRTRNAILAAAASVLARDRNATLADIAQAANVGRSTLHRYFDGREELINATIEDSIQTLDRTVDEAAIEQGPPAEAMRRLVAAMVDVGDRMLFLFGDPRTLEGHQRAGDWDNPPEDPVLDLIKRGQAEGVFDPEVSPLWIQHTLWTIVYTGCEDANAGHLLRHEIVPTVIRTLENGIRIQ